MGPETTRAELALHTYSGKICAVEDVIKLNKTEGRFRGVVSLSIVFKYLHGYGRVRHSMPVLVR